jgi:hypothetical protein
MRDRDIVWPFERSDVLIISRGGDADLEILNLLIVVFLFSFFFSLFLGGIVAIAF